MTKTDVDKPAPNGNCPQCGKRIDSDSRAGSLTSYLFQNSSCRCNSSKSVQQLRPAKEGERQDFCPRCGLRNSGEVRAGSITGFLFQDIRCKCAPDEVFGAEVMNEKLWKLKQSDAGKTFSAGSDKKSKSSSKSINLAKGAIIGGAYRIVKLIGRGGMGEVYRAEHLTLSKTCALKVIPPDQVTEIGWQRFQTEAKAVAKLNHINLVKVSDLGIHDGCLPFYAMEYVDGRTMAELLEEQGPMPLNTALDIFAQICDGLDYSHRNGIIHRDIKPANIMLTKGVGGKISVKILDFGLAKQTHQDRNKQSLTAIGEVLGSPYYMSPEQCEGDRIDIRSDIYSAGCTLFECLVGTPPFDDNIPAAIVRAHMTAEAPSLESVVGPDIFPDALEVVIAKLLRKNPVERYQTMSELRGDLSRVARGENVLPFYMSRNNYSGNEGQIAVSQDDMGKGVTGSDKLQIFSDIAQSRRGQAILALICAAVAGIGGGAWLLWRWLSH